MAQPKYEPTPVALRLAAMLRRVVENATPPRTQAQIAEEAGISLHHLSQVINARSGVTIETADKILQVCGLEGLFFAGTDY